MMSLKAYESLPLDLQASYLWDNGRYLTSCRDHRYCINLYSLHSYFVEVWYDTRLSHIHAITSFTNSRRLDSYLESVSVSSLI